MRFKTFLEGQGKRDTDFGNSEGWEAGVEQVWPDAKITRKSVGKANQLVAEIGSRVVGIWDFKADSGFIELEDS